MRKRLILVLALVAALTLSLVVASGASAAKHKAGGKRGAAVMRATADKAVVGTSLLRYRGKGGGILRGWVIVTGLAPGSSHAWHVHGHVAGSPAAPGNCKSQDDPVVVAMPDLTADASGVAIVRVNMKGVGKNPLLRGNYINVHELSSADGAGPGIVCGMVKKTIV